MTRPLTEAQARGTAWSGQSEDYGVARVGRSAGRVFALEHGAPWDATGGVSLPRADARPS
ncbi:hypothetical protein [Streptomyces sp. NPDC014623]|uniref:hypothetical protein n=1 Tax=Streptomyces sp. NPDC014623 TaxID=3364875 RepID=UPI0036FB5E1F